MRVAEALVLGTEELTQKGIERPAVESRLLLVDVLRCSPVDVIANDDMVLTSALKEQWRELLDRRLAHEPFAYLNGHKEFYGLDFSVSRDVLIPRPETEGLVEGVLRWIKAKNISRGLIVDIGTGSGCIAVSLAKNLPRSFQFLGIDVSNAALSIASQNATQHGLSNIEFKKMDMISDLAQISDSLIWISNPPYIPRAQISELESEIKTYEPHLALDGGEDGLDFYRAIIDAFARESPSPQLLALETMGYEQIEKIRGLVPASASIVDESPHIYWEKL